MVSKKPSERKYASQTAFIILSIAVMFLAFTTIVQSGKIRSLREDVFLMTNQQLVITRAVTEGFDDIGGFSQDVDRRLENLEYVVGIPGHDCHVMQSPVDQYGMVMVRLPEGSVAGAQTMRTHMFRFGNVTYAAVCPD